MVLYIKFTCRDGSTERLWILLCQTFSKLEIVPQIIACTTLKNFFHYGSFGALYHMWFFGASMTSVPPIPIIALFFFGSLGSPDPLLLLQLSIGVVQWTARDLVELVSTDYCPLLTTANHMLCCDHILSFPTITAHNMWPWFLNGSGRVNERHVRGGNKRFPKARLTDGQAVVWYSFIAKFRGKRYWPKDSTVAYWIEPFGCVSHNTAYLIIITMNSFDHIH